MPHLIIEYTDNLKAEGNIPALLDKMADVLRAHGDVFPVGGIRVRAVVLHDYVVADGQADDAFVHATLKIGSGRSEDEKEAIGTALFETLKTHFAALFDQRFLALSMELYEFPRPTYKHSNIHARFKK